MRLDVAIIGPHDLVDRTTKVAREFPGLVPLPHAYRHERETAALVRAAMRKAEAFLFTGPIPYYLAQREGLAGRPAAYVLLTGASLFRALLRIQLTKRGDIRRLSIDTLSSREVRDAYLELGVETAHVFAKEYASPVSTQDLVQFHRDLWKAGRTTVALTCLRSAYRVLQRSQPAFRLIPTIQSIRVGLNTILLRSIERRLEYAQVAIMLVDALGRDASADQESSDAERRAREQALRENLGRHAQRFGGMLHPLEGGRFMILTTRGALEQETSGFTRAPILKGLADPEVAVRAGIGIGTSVLEAEGNARRALRRAKVAQGNHVALALDTETVLSLPFEGRRSRIPADTTLLAKHLGLSRRTVERLQALIKKRGSNLTAHDVAQGFQVTTRSARRLLNRLRVHGAATVAENAKVGIGRPRHVFRTLV